MMMKWGEAGKILWIKPLFMLSLGALEKQKTLARVSHRSSSRDGEEVHDYKARTGKWAQAYFHSTSRSFFKRKAVGMGLSAVGADYW